MKTLINFATRSRAKKFHACMANLRQCFTNYEVALKVDRNDPTLREYLSVYYPEIILCLGYSESKVHAINRDIPKDWDIIVNTSDDILWKSGAGQEILNNMEPDTFLHFPEPYAESQADKKKRNSTCVVSIMDRIYYDRFGYVYNSEYDGFYCDNEATTVARMLGRHKFVDKVICEHLHFVNKKTSKDKLYTINYLSMPKDKQTFLRRQKINFGLNEVTVTNG